MLAVAAACSGCAGADDGAESWEEFSEDEQGEEFAQDDELAEGEELAGVDDLAEGDEIGRLEAAIGEATCKSANADATLQGGGSLTIQPGYDNPSCDKSYVIRVNNWAASSNKYFILTWADDKPANSFVCQNTRLRMDTYKLVNGAFTFDATRETTGSWQNGKCFIGAAGRLVPSSGTWKVAVQGIWNVQGTPTYKIKFQTS